MSELILHHYAISPFAEKARLMLGFKGLSWRSVSIPSILPKPDLTALTGGYRKTPVLQVGADIYCDTALIARRLEAEKCSPSFYPEGQEFTCASLASWADSVLFLHSASLVFQPASLAVRFAKVPPEAVKAFIADRSTLFDGGSATRLPLELAQHQWPTLMNRLDTQLQRNGDFLLGVPSIADFSVAHNFWFLKQTPVTAPLVDDYPAVLAWYQRVIGFGHGAASELSPADAIEIARNATPVALPEEAFIDPNGFNVGQQVSVSAVDYGVDLVEGELAFNGREEIILRREDARAGVVHVHFPRYGFRISAV
ncbi:MULTISPECIES: glutathione S-transferase family protein [unclassified Pseudomonas]|uniref:glutathione S-transferase family protein n=1 Tax=unclassified Pseudomonas TaxID=196821 RepID=UPI0025F2C14E|nr:MULTISPECIES: glutathione S-transferase family protein [unclassified Pseudomonas]